MESLATPARVTRNRSWSKACIAWSIAVTIAPGWQPWPAPDALRKRAGRINDLAGASASNRPPAATGIGHTAGPRTAGQRRNAHPHLGGNGLVAVVHNGVIENYATLKRQLQAEGVVFHSDTDTEVIAQLIAHHLTATWPRR